MFLAQVLSIKKNKHSTSECTFIPYVQLSFVSALRAKKYNHPEDIYASWQFIGSYEVNQPRSKPTRHEVENEVHERGKPRGIIPFGGANKRSSSFKSCLFQSKPVVVYR